MRALERAIITNDDQYVMACLAFDELVSGQESKELVLEILGEKYRNTIEIWIREYCK